MTPRAPTKPRATAVALPAPATPSDAGWAAGVAAAVLALLGALALR